MVTRLFLAGLLALVSSGSGPPRVADAQEEELLDSFRKEGLVLGREEGFVALPATVQIKNDLLEYVLVAPNGAAHESLFLTRARASVLNAALLLLGAEPGRNARWVPLEGGGDGGQAADGRPRRRLEPPQGDGFYLYVAWREGEEVYFYRLEDVIRNLESGRSLRRHRFVYLGSRFAQLDPKASEAFLAEVTGNLINLAFFFQGDTLLTGALEECNEQTIWAANEWLLPPTGARVSLVFARRPLAVAPPLLVPTLPVLESEDPLGSAPR
jgi:hypothetical protein